jgi:hypothetical protein
MSSSPVSPLRGSTFRRTLMSSSCIHSEYREESFRIFFWLFAPVVTNINFEKTHVVVIAGFSIMLPLLWKQVFSAGAWPKDRSCIVKPGFSLSMPGRGFFVTANRRWEIVEKIQCPIIPDIIYIFWNLA